MYDIIIHRVDSLSQKKLKELLETKDTHVWKDELLMNDSYLYKDKTNIKEADFHENDESTRTSTQCRSNTLNLNHKNRHANDNTRCTECNTHEGKTHEYFLQYCTSYTHIGQNLNFLHYNSLTDDETQVILLLLTGKK